METLNKIREIIAEQLDIELEKIISETTFEELDADSLDLVELVMALEEEFEIEISDEEIEKIKSVNDVVNYINTRL